MWMASRRRPPPSSPHRRRSGARIADARVVGGDVERTARARREVGAVLLQRATTRRSSAPRSAAVRPTWSWPRRGALCGRGGSVAVWPPTAAACSADAPFASRASTSAPAPTSSASRAPLRRDGERRDARGPTRLAPASRRSLSGATRFRRRRRSGPPRPRPPPTRAARAWVGQRRLRIVRGRAARASASVGATLEGLERLGGAAWRSAASGRASTAAPSSTSAASAAFDTRAAAVHAAGRFPHGAGARRSSSTGG